MATRIWMCDVTLYKACNHVHPPGHSQLLTLRQLDRGLLNVPEPMSASLCRLALCTVLIALLFKDLFDACPYPVISCPHHEALVAQKSIPCGTRPASPHLVTSGPSRRSPVVAADPFTLKLWVERRFHWAAGYWGEI